MPPLLDYPQVVIFALLASTLNAVIFCLNQELLTHLSTNIVHSLKMMGQVFYDCATGFPNSLFSHFRVLVRVLSPSHRRALDTAGQR